MEPLLLMPSTTSHKREPLLPALEMFAALGFTDLDLNLNHIIERGVSPEAVRDALDTNEQCVRIVSGGWCDFFDAEPRIAETFASVERQVALARFFGVVRLRLFFGRLPADAWDARSLDTIGTNLRQLADAHPDMHFVLENHDGASSQPVICRTILEHVDRANVRLNFDPINFAHAGVEPLAALRIVLPWIAHVHLKGLDRAGFCEFGEGDVDLQPVLRELLASDYRGGFSVEYEGEYDRTLRLYLGVRNARVVLDDLLERKGT
jgi:sugar phosphate isomerase/epimerase